VASMGRQPRRLHVKGNDFTRPGHVRLFNVQVDFGITTGTLSGFSRGWLFSCKTDLSFWP
jgi:hypothetical protein